MKTIAAGAALLGVWLAVGSHTAGTGTPWLEATQSPSRSAPATSADTRTHEEVIEQYCVRCHNERRLAGNMTLEAFDDGVAMDAATRRKLKDEKVSKRGGGDVPVGTVLTREWKGIPQSVRRTPAGFEWNGTTYRSLTAAARAISGGTWGGPLFFGLVGGRGGQG